MLWTLHNRASEARRPDGLIDDPASVRIYESIDYDYARSFGAPDETHAIRSRLFDEALRPWMAAHPGGTVVELAAGLETQFQRCDDGRVAWLCVDVPESIAVRERFLRPSGRCRHVARSALDFEWMDEVDPSRGVFVTAQGLFMYLAEADVRRLFTAIADRFPGVEVMFDTIPPWFSRRTLRGGFAKTAHYRTPAMPWGVKRSEVAGLVRRWSPRVTAVAVVPYGVERGLPGRLMKLFDHVPVLRDLPPAIVHVETSV
jgi:O-methyltransferase involved in polyketide biosynthesis